MGAGGDVKIKIWEGGVGIKRAVGGAVQVGSWCELIRRSPNGGRRTEVCSARGATRG